jgi:hypothetical protein
MTEHQPGEVILGRYEIERVLGRGGFGTTWSARDQQTGAYVAVKALDLSRVDDWKAVELFSREAQTLEQLDHPRIPRYLDFVPVQADATGYLVQSLAPGEPLDDVLQRRGRFSNAELEGVAERTLEILTYLEGLNPPVVHRDIKPANLLIGPDSHVYLVDFGAVQDAAKRSTEGGSTVAGTFGYMAPEQLHGAASPRSDLFSLGMTLLHLGTGRNPSELPRKGLKVSFEEFVDLPPEFVTFIDKLVAPDPDARWGSAAEALAFLREDVPLSPNLARLPAASTSLADQVQAREEAERRAMIAAGRAKQRDMQRAHEKVARRKPRITLAKNGDELLISYRQPRLGVAVITGSIALFLYGNPGFVIAGGFPFLGAQWPFFADYWPGRWAVWGAVMFFTWLAILLWLTPPVNLRLSRDGLFAKYGRREKGAEVGRFNRLQVESLAPERGYPAESLTVRLVDSRGSSVLDVGFSELSKADVDTMMTVPQAWLSEDI